MNLRLLVVVTAALLITLATSSAWGMYNPRIGRFMQRDPNGMQIGPERNIMRSIAARRSFIQRDFNPHRQYTDGMNVYAAHHLMLGKADPSGLRIRSFKNCGKSQTSDLKYLDSLASITMLDAEIAFSKYDTNYAINNMLRPLLQTKFHMESSPEIDLDTFATRFRSYWDYFYSRTYHRFQGISDRFSGVKSYDVDCCGDDRYCEDKYEAYASGSTVYLCKSFWDSTRDGQLSIFIHEVAHLEGAGHGLYEGDYTLSYLNTSILAANAAYNDASYYDHFATGSGRERWYLVAGVGNPYIRWLLEHGF